MTQSKEHQELKAYGRKVLEKLGFEIPEIHEEYLIKFEGMKEQLIVDVAGISPIRKVAVECGTTPTDKVINLRMYFDEVILLPYFADKVSRLFINDRQHLVERFTQQEKEILNLKSKIKQLEKKIAEKNPQYQITAAEHEKIITIRKDKGLGMIAIGKLTHRSSKTVHSHISSHNSEINSTGQCSKCKQVNSSFATILV